MRTIKWETIKKNAIEQFYWKSGGNGATIGNYDSSSFLALYAACCEGRELKDPRTILKEWIDYGCDLIKEWDIRRADKLIELLPGCVPVHCQKMKIVEMCYDDKGWVVVFG